MEEGGSGGGRGREERLDLNKANSRLNNSELN